MAYLGCVFTQHKTDEKGHPVRDYESTTYVQNTEAAANNLISLGIGG
jgi:hypothetical protein